MSEHAQQRHQHSEPEDDESPVRPAGAAGRARAQRQEPGDEDEFDLIGDDDLGIADLGPLAPGTTDPDAGSGRIRKVTRAGEHQPR
jgi:hypothetical protein